MEERGTRKPQIECTFKNGWVLKVQSRVSRHTQATVPNACPERPPFVGVDGGVRVGCDGLVGMGLWTATCVTSPSSVVGRRPCRRQSCALGLGARFSVVVGFLLVDRAVIESHGVSHVCGGLIRANKTAVTHPCVCLRPVVTKLISLRSRVAATLLPRTQRGIHGFGQHVKKYMHAYIRAAA